MKSLKPCLRRETMGYRLLLFVLLWRVQTNGYFNGYIILNYYLGGVIIYGMPRSSRKMSTPQRCIHVHVDIYMYVCII